MNPGWKSSVIVRTDEDTIQAVETQPVTQERKSKFELNIYSSICLPHSFKKENFSFLCRKKENGQINTRCVI